MSYNSLNRKPKQLQIACAKVVFVGTLPDVKTYIEHFSETMTVTSGPHKQGETIYMCDIQIRECKSANGNDIQERLNNAAKKANVSVKANLIGKAFILPSY